MAKPLSIDEQENAVVRSEPGKIKFFIFITIIVYLSGKYSGMI